MQGLHLTADLYQCACSPELLIDAQKHPENYKDLIVRVAGYSDHFHNLSKVLQDEIIGRTEQNFN